MAKKRALLLMAYGGPDSLADVEAYVKDIRGGRPVPPEVVKAQQERYAAIGGRSPILALTERQAAGLQRAMTASDSASYQSFVGMRHWRPTIRDAVQKIADSKIKNVLALCMSPFNTPLSMGAYRNLLNAALEEVNASAKWKEDLEVVELGAWYKHPAFIRMLGNHVRKAYEAASETGNDPVVVFTAHSLPASIVEKGDPYDLQYSELCQLVTAEAGLTDDQWRRSYQCAGGGGIPWLGPSLEQILAELEAEGCKSVLIVPAGFTCDHVEVLYDLDIEVKQLLESKGIQYFRTESLNDTPEFISAMSEILLSINPHWS
ncbi:MAG TPA: ferrochelatase [Bellilinea sp.]|nr:ferrochelatase [Bellilinea sp.]